MDRLDASIEFDGRPRVFTPDTGALESPSGKSFAAGRSPDEDEDGGGVEEGCRGGDGCFGVLPQPSVPADPGEESFDDPSPGLDDEADLVGLSSDDLDGDRGGGGEARPLITGIGEHCLDEGEVPARVLQDGAACVTILDAGGMDGTVRNSVCGRT